MYHDFLILGGAGLVGLQVCRPIVTHLDPRRIVVASLKEKEAVEACQKLEAEFGDRIAFVPEWGNLFVPTDLSETSRGAILKDASLRRRLLEAEGNLLPKAYLRHAKLLEPVVQRALVAEQELERCGLAKHGRARRFVERQLCQAGREVGHRRSRMEGTSCFRWIDAMTPTSCHGSIACLGSRSFGCVSSASPYMRCDLSPRAPV